MRRRILTTLAAVVALWLIAIPTGAPSVKDMFVATTQAAEETDGAMCTMPDADASNGVSG